MPRARRLNGLAEGLQRGLPAIARSELRVAAVGTPHERALQLETPATNGILTPVRRRDGRVRGRHENVTFYLLMNKLVGVAVSASTARAASAVG